VMDEQPVRGEIPWPRPPVLWGLWRNDGKTFASVRMVHGAGECCTQCGETTFANEIAYLVTLEQSGKWLTLLFHRACYVAWEKSEASSTEAQASPVTVRDADL
jgi:hypothetical protein